MSGQQRQRTAEVSSNDESMLEFEHAMSQFQSMFPDIDPRTIEAVLRKFDGDVSSTIDELLKLSSSGSASSSSSYSSQQEYLSGAGMNHQGQQSMGDVRRSSASKPTHEEQPNCVDDEKIALLIQNREFLRYLQRDAQFMRELNGGPGSSQFGRGRNFDNRYHGNYYQRRHLQALPVLLSSTRPCSSQNNYRFDTCRCDEDDRSAWKKRTGKYDEPAAALPEGPIVDFSQGSIPNGPLIDYVDPSVSSSGNKWAEKIKSHLPLHKKSSKSPSTPTEEDYSAVDWSHYDTENHLSDRLKNMNRNSKSLFLSLAKKFSLSKPNELARPSDVGEQTKEFSFDIHKST